jgi:hypothetical protein
MQPTAAATNSRWVFQTSVDVNLSLSLSLSLPKAANGAHHLSTVPSPRLLCDKFIVSSVQFSDVGASDRHPGVCAWPWDSPPPTSGAHSSESAAASPPTMAA